jgi:diguanylate cyclase (GGDEF)-like protein/PAS domain S-box-containing protein
MTDIARGSAPGESVSRTTLQVLLIEDSPDQAEIVRELLGSLRPYRVRMQHESRLAAGLQRLQEMDFDLILLDLHLPDCRGPECTRRIRSAAGSAPIVVLTNVEDEDTALETLREGAEDYLVKRQLDAHGLLRSMRYAMERARAESALRESEERYALALAGANDGLWDWNLQSGEIYVSPRWRLIVGLGDDAHVDEPTWFAQVHPDDLPGLRAALSSHLAGRSAHFEFDHRVRSEDGGYRWASARGLAVRADDGAPYRIAGSVTDITRRKLAEEQLLHDALHDALTRLPNRALLIDRLEQAMKRFEREPTARFAVLFFDLDRFKTINDSLGHTVGDELLVSIARRLETFLRPGDTVARLGGDEFAILLSDIRDNVHIAAVAERVHELLSEVFHIHGHELYASASIGIALSAPDYERPEEMLRDADLAMYRAKSSAGASYEIFDSAMHESVLALHRLEMDLRRATEHHEFCNHYQTIVSLETGRVVGFEALLRWHHPQWGLMMPETFIDVAEETGLIVPIGWRVLEEACRQTRQWQQLFPVDPPLTISVNVSGRVFLGTDFEARTEQILRDSGLPAHSLRLEITEKAIMSHAEEVLESLGRLRALGIQLYIDDFGTGYSSLTYLQRFSYDSLKIDRCFVSDLASGGDGSAIVRAIVALAESLDMNVIAEGVETEEQLEVLRTMKCREAQGFRFSHPMDAASMHQHLLSSLAARG